jgi:transcriptional regulator with XRE-family HTH domain
MNPHETLPNVIGHLIRAARKARGLTQSDLAAQMEITDSAVCQWEKGKTIPSGVSLLKLSGLLTINFPSVEDPSPSYEKIGDVGASGSQARSELLDEIETAFDMLTALDKAGDGIGGDVGHGISAVALAARSALDNARSMARAMGAK